jgi:hypothetical protein
MLQVVTLDGSNDIELFASYFSTDFKKRAMVFLESLSCIHEANFCRVV